MADERMADGGWPLPVLGLGLNQIELIDGASMLLFTDMTTTTL